ncbi:SAM-dependent methyltransferase, partial [Streptomyces umbrinus]
MQTEEVKTEEVKIGGERPGVDWDAESATFDDEPDHGLRDPAVREAWAARL